ncbi:Conserved DNA-binding protein YbaB [Sinosporangium album]|uniref:Conserved DNA-binding protein YbaB n=1 Tax=Sinosporangium album TaxID=504805 RepID=A0A1G7YWS8_9ACTN|nr:YbaB/EbfC family nucleoid-associated protein [Sinosporangium album]SDH00805.1 Conserved DNA-binding protein YbaB [Sinosporangium album]
MDYTDAAGLQAYADELRSAFMKMQGEARTLHQQARAIQVTETSRDGLVSATVGVRGDLIRLDLDPRIFRRPDARGLADTITETLRRASAKAADAVVELFEPLAPAEQVRAQLDGDLDAMMGHLADQMAGKRPRHGEQT